MSDNVAKIMHNTVCVLAFVLLAIKFSHWWFVFFALIFFMYPSSNSTYIFEDETKGNDDEQDI